MLQVQDKKPEKAAGPLLGTSAGHERAIIQTIYILQYQLQFKLLFLTTKIF